MNRRDMVFFNTAKEIAKLSDYPQHHLGAVCVYKNRILSSGYNTRKSNPLQKKYNKYRFSTDLTTCHSCHAETNALLPILKMDNIDRSRIRIYLYRSHADGSLALSKPCPSCRKMLLDAGIRHIYYTTETSYMEEFIMEEQRNSYLAKEQNQGNSWSVTNLFHHGIIMPPLNIQSGAKYRDCSAQVEGI